MTAESTPTPVTIRGDARRIPLADNTVQCIVTSPPYLGQRVYGASDQEVGLEHEVHAYALTLMYTAEEFRRVLTDDGLLWLNLGDKANGSGGAGGDYQPGASKSGRTRYGKFYDRHFLPQQFLDVPGKVLASLQGNGWRLRQTIVWDKGQESREDLEHIGRPRTSHEVIYMLAPGKTRPKFYPHRLTETGSVWHFPPAHREGKSHDAPFPDQLALRCISPSTDVGDVVLDPFSGSGTTPRVATDLHRLGVGLDLYAGATE